MTDSHSAPRAESDAATWKQCGPCAWAKHGGPPCYYHNSKFGVGKLITTVQHIAEIATTTAEIVTSELATAVDKELEEWP